MDGDQQLNFYYLDPVAVMDRYIGQPKFAGKTYMKFETQESRGQSGRNQSFLFQKVHLIDMHSVPYLHLLYTDISFTGMYWW